MTATEHISQFCSGAVLFGTFLGEGNARPFPSVLILMGSYGEEAPLRLHCP